MLYISYSIIEIICLKILKIKIKKKLNKIKLYKKIIFFLYNSFIELKHED